MTPRLLDLFCGVGGAAMGYHRAGFDVVGVDHRPQPRYPFAFVRADAFAYLAEHGAAGFDAIHASPPCQHYSAIRHRPANARRDHPDVVGRTRECLRASGVPYVIENVPGAPLIDAVVLCGSSFGLDLRRHRLFEATFPLLVPPCAHGWQAPRFVVRYGGSRRRPARLSGVVTVAGHEARADEARRVMQIPWGTRDEVNQAVPPAYTELIGYQLAGALRAGAVAA